MVAGDTPGMNYHPNGVGGVDNNTPSCLMPLELIQTRPNTESVQYRLVQIVHLVQCRKAKNHTLLDGLCLSMYSI